MDNITTILALSPHTDDIEFGAGGTIAKWIELGKVVYYVAFSIAERSVPQGLPKDILEEEVRKATKVLDIAPDNLYVYKFEVRTFPQFRQEILDVLIDLRQKLSPDLVLLPSLKDLHQDHHTIAEEGIRAFKHTSGGKFFRVVERVGLDDLTKERQLIRSTRKEFEEDNKMKPLLFAGLLVQGGVVSYEANLKSGGIGARYLGIGNSKQYREDTVTISLRLVSVSTGEVLMETLAGVCL